MTTSRSIPYLVVAALMLLVASAAGEPQRQDLVRRGSHAVQRSVEQELERGLAVGVGGGTRFKTIGNTRIPLRPNHPATRCYTFAVEAGRMEVRVPETDLLAASVLIRTPGGGSFVSLGGLAEVLVANDQTLFVVRHGAALVAVGNDWRQLEAGQVLSLNAGRTQSRSIVGAPQLTVERTVLMARDGETRDAAIRIEPVAGAGHYEVRVVDDDRPPVTVPRFLAHQGFIPIPSLAPGEYRVRVRAVDSSGVPGASTTTGLIRVIAFEIPDGGIVEEESVWLPPGGRVRLVEPAGLELTYGAVNPYFIPAPSDIGVTRGRSTVARIRVKGTSDEARLELNPRPSAEIEAVAEFVGERLYRVKVDVVVFDSSGQVSTAARVHKRVLVDGREVEVGWRRRGARHRAEFEVPLEGAPPTILVQVEDGVGPLVSKSVPIPGGT